MATNRGFFAGIGGIDKEGQKAIYAVQAMETFNADGKPVTLRGMTDAQDLFGELYRKSCARCHLGIQSIETYSVHHDAGCAACHFPFNETGAYVGGDATVRGKRPYSASHDMEALPGNRVCLRCHTSGGRSGRNKLYYLGLDDGNNAQVPTIGGMPGPRVAAGGRSLRAIGLDVHAAAGMQCIDCHISREVMGDGYSYRDMRQKTEVNCRDCHGDPGRPPMFAEIVRENELPVRESRSYALQMGPGVKMALTTRGNMYSNVFRRGVKVYTLGKRSGKLHDTKIITGSPAHTIVGHERLACYSCHSRTVAQSYGFQIEYDRTGASRDYLNGEMTPGRFNETEDYRTLYPFPLALDSRGMILPVSPEYKNLVSVRSGGAGNNFVDEVFAADYSHNIGKKAIGCSECHANPAFLGFGQHLISAGESEAILLGEDLSGSPLDGFSSFEGGRVKSSLDSRAGLPRALNTEEVRRVLAVNQCIVCHEKKDDPIYQKPLDYNQLGDCLERLSAAER
jgi:hypothetical protein